MIPPEPVQETDQLRVWRWSAPSIPDQFCVECRHCGHKTAWWGTRALAEQELIIKHIEAIHPELALSIAELRKTQGRIIYRTAEPTS